LKINPKQGETNGKRQEKGQEKEEKQKEEGQEEVRPPQGNNLLFGQGSGKAREVTRPDVAG